MLLVLAAEQPAEVLPADTVALVANYLTTCSAASLIYSVNTLLADHGMPSAPAGCFEVLGECAVLQTLQHPAGATCVHSATV
jgi:hypothetical protein